MHTRFWQVYLKERAHLANPDVDITLKWTLKKSDGWVWTGFTWLRLETSGGFL